MGNIFTNSKYIIKDKGYNNILSLERKHNKIKVIFNTTFSILALQIIYDNNVIINKGLSVLTNTIKFKQDHIFLIEYRKNLFELINNIYIKI